MPVVKPFRALRYRGASAALGGVDLAAVVAVHESRGDTESRDPRHVRRLFDEAGAEGDGKDAPVRRAKALLADWLRAGVLVRDEQPGMIAVRRRTDDGEALGFFGALHVRSLQPSSAPAPVPTASTAIPASHKLAAVGVAAQPVLVAFDGDRGKVKRALETATDREPDAQLATADGATWEIFSIDDDSTTARISALLEGASAEIVGGDAALQAHQALAAERAPRVGGGSDDDSAERASSYALAFLFPKDGGGAAFAAVPAGLALFVVDGTL